MSRTGCSWCGSEKTLVGAVSVVQDVDGATFATPGRSACKDHVGHLVAWREEAEDPMSLWDRAYALVTWLMVVWHGWQLDADGVCWQGPRSVHA